MPERPLRPCSHPGCRNLVRKGKCDLHKRRMAQDISERDRPSSYSRMYDSRWAAARLAWLRERPLCGDRLTGPSAEHSECVREGKKRIGNEVDHIVRHAGNRERFWAKENWQTLCRHCHAVKTSYEMNALKSIGTTR